MQQKSTNNMAPAFHFLVIDDQPITRSILMAMLNKIGHKKVSQAEDGQKALALIQSGESVDPPVNFIVSDWRMPIMDGLELLRTVRTTKGLQHLPVLLMTTDAEREKIDVALQAGADGYIDKQFLNAGFLDVTLKKILKNRGYLYS
jgi:two-component system chemotaxis response regulator CheY